MQPSHPVVRPRSTAASQSQIRLRAPARRLCALFAAAIPVLLTSCRQTEPVRGASGPVEVEVALVEGRDVPVVKEWVGTLDGYVNAEIRGQVMGYLVRQAYREGSFVRQGDLLFEIDPRPFQAALNEANAGWHKGTLLEQTMPPEVPAGIPSQLLERRPDVLQGEMAVRAANAQIGIATAALFPKIGLTALFGRMSSPLEDFTIGRSNLFSGAASAGWPHLGGPRAASPETAGGGGLGTDAHRVRTDGAGRLSRCFERAHHARKTGSRAGDPGASRRRVSRGRGGFHAALHGRQVGVLRGARGAAAIGACRKRAGADGVGSPPGDRSAL